MTLQKTFLAAIACATLSLGVAGAQPDPNSPQEHRTDRDEKSPPQKPTDRNQKPPQQNRTNQDQMGGAMRGGAPGVRPDQRSNDGPGANRNDGPGANRNERDRYWKPQYHGTVGQDRIFGALRGHGYKRFDGTPYWYQGRYVVKSFDRSGRRIFIEVNPYTGAYIGVVRF
jgi:hypothetical protein